MEPAVFPYFFLPQHRSCDTNADLGYDDDHALSWIMAECEIFYQNRCSDTMINETGYHDNFELFEEHIFRPENARGFKQHLIVCMLLLQHYKYHIWTEH